MEHLEQNSAEAEANFFMATIYPEVKDLGKQFITLLSGVLAFTITFADKIVDLQNSGLPSKVFLMLCWLLFVAAIIFIGVALWWNYNIAMTASQHKIDHAYNILRRVYRLFLLGGFSFVLGLGFLVLSGITRLFGDIVIAKL
jgi:hypothetical protein